MSKLFMQMPSLVNENTGKSVDVDFVITTHSSIVAISMIGKPHRLTEMRKYFKSWTSFELKDRLSDTSMRLSTGGEPNFIFSSNKHHDMTHCIGYNLKLMEDTLVIMDNKPFIEALTLFLQEKKQLPVTEDIVSKVVRTSENTSSPYWHPKVFFELDIITNNPSFENVKAYHIDVNQFIKTMEGIEFSAEKSDFDWDSIETIDQYILTFLEPIKEKILNNIQVLFNKNTPLPDIIFKGKKQPFKGQLPIIGSCIEVLKRPENRFCYLAAEQGVGKTLMSILTSIGYFSEIGNSTPCTFVLCPATTISQWKDEIKSCCSNPFNVNIEIISDTSQFIKLYEKTKFKFNKPTYILCSKETFKLSYEEYPVYTRKTKEITYEVIDKKSKTNTTITEKMDALFCIDCGKPLMLRTETKGDVFLSELDFKRRNSRNSKCPHCESVLWSATYLKTKKCSVIDYIKARRIKFDLVLVDEMQESNNVTSLIGTGTHTILANHCKKALALSGTPNNGYASSLYNVISAFLRKTLHKNKIFSLKDFIEAYGTLEAVYKQGEVEYSYNGELITKQSDFKEVEGINSLVFAKYLASNFVSATLSDIADNLPPLNEYYIGIDPSAELLQAENDFSGKIKSKQCLKTLGSTVLRHYVNNPFNWGAVELFDESCTPASLDENTLLPKEEELLSILKAEVAEGRKCMVYIEFNDKGGKYLQGSTIPTRMLNILHREGFRTFYLDTSTCKRTERKDILEKNKNKADIFICNRALVSVGLNLQFIPTYINYIPSFMVNLIDQANRRGFRANSTLENRVYHLYYKNVYEQRAIEKYQRKKAESNAIQGKFDVELELESVRTASSFSKNINDSISSTEKECVHEYIIKESIDIFANSTTSIEVTVEPVIENFETPSLFDLEKQIDTDTSATNKVDTTNSEKTSKTPLPLFAESGQISFDFSFISNMRVSRKKPQKPVENQIDLFSIFA